jgi:nucleotide-binding universal stress UspA family protein
MYQRILVPVDGSPASNKGLREAIALARLTGGRILLLHVVDDMSLMITGADYVGLSAEVFAALREAGEKVLAEAKNDVERAGVPVETRLYENIDLPLWQRAVALVGEWHADLVVMGTHGRRGVRRVVLGSDAEQVVRTASVPVLLVRGSGDASTG